jgi:transposase-like protein
MSKYNKHVYVPSSRQNSKEAFSKAVIVCIVEEVEKGASRKELCKQYGMSSGTLGEWMTRYGSAKYLQNKKKSFSKAERNVTARAVLEGRISVEQAALSKGIRKSTIKQWVKQKQQDDAELSVLNPQVMPLKSTASDKALAAELSVAMLKIKALETMIDIAEEHFKIPIRKKSGAKQLGR